jgi:hypothetical protein
MFTIVIESMTSEYNLSKYAKEQSPVLAPEMTDSIYVC